jgi:hypothetical protein
LSADGAGLLNRRGDSEDGLIGKADGSLGHRINIAGESPVGEVIHEGAGEPAASLKPFQFLFVEASGFQVLQNLFESGSNEKAAGRRQIPKVELIRSDAIHAFVEEAFQHRQHVEVREQDACGRIHGNSKSTCDVEHYTFGRTWQTPNCPFRRTSP